MSTDDMTHEQLQIHAAYGKVLAELEETYKRFMQDALDNAENYEGLTADDAVIWFLESF